MIPPRLPPGTAPHYLMKAKILSPVPEENSTAPLSTSRRRTRRGEGRSPPQSSCRTPHPTPTAHQGSRQKIRVLPVLADRRPGDELSSLPPNQHGVTERDRTVPSSRVSHLFVTSPKASASQKTVF